jgi:DHA1 family inner membrane transport protein
MVARVITSLTHGAFFGIGSVVAASLVPRDKQASAVATMFRPDDCQYRRRADLA